MLQNDVENTYIGQVLAWLSTNDQHVLVLGKQCNALALPDDGFRQAHRE